MALKAVALDSQVPFRLSAQVTFCNRGASLQDCKSATCGPLRFAEIARTRTHSQRLASSSSPFCPSSAVSFGWSKENRPLDKKRGVQAVLDVPPLVDTSRRDLERELADRTRKKAAELVELSPPGNADVSNDRGASGSEGVVDDEIRPPRGETAGAVLVVEDAIISVGGNDLLSGANLRLVPKQKLAVVGPNGAGKSTLIRACVGKLAPEGGRIVVSQGVHVGYLEQTAVSGSNRSVWEEAASRMDDINQAWAAVEEAEEELDRAEERGLADKEIEAISVRLMEHQERLEAVGGYRKDEMIAGVLDGLGFAKSDWEKKCSEFSGGWQMRIALARLLLSTQSASQGGKKDTLLVLDEPTNHLDVSARGWLAGHLKASDSACMVVTHDENLLDNMGIERIAEVARGTLEVYNCGYQKFLLERQARLDQAVRAYEKQQEEIAHMQEFINKLGAKATKASAAQSRMKAIARIDKLEAPVSDKPKARVVIDLPAPLPSAVEVLKLKDGAIGWTKEAPLMQDVQFTIERGQRVVLLGPNGAGKSTLLHTLAGNHPLQGGERILGRDAKLGVFTQDLAQYLPQDKSGLDYIMDVATEDGTHLTLERGRSMLGALGLSGDKALRPISALSGGEKARVALATFVLRPCNVMMLDEPSNHLDKATVEALTAALKIWKGAVLVISHDREFCTALEPTHVARVLPGGQFAMRHTLLGEVEFDNAAEEESNGRKEKKNAGEKKGGAEGVQLDRNTLSKKLKDVKRRIAKLEELMQKEEQVCAQCDSRMVDAGADVKKAMDEQKKKDASQAKLAKYEEEWEAKEEERESLQQTWDTCGF